MSKAVNSKWKKTFPDTIGNQNRPATGVDDTQPFETGAFPQYMANDPVRYDLQNAAMSQSMSNDARLKEMVDARGKELDDHKVDPGAHKTGIAGNAATATKVVTTAAAGASANIAEASTASNDLARIRVSGATNAGELALETADDGSEPIVARQYTGVYTAPVRTAKILDESGNTSFPGTVVAPKFTGTLNGNAATATKLQTPRTLSLTGKAAGSTTFDGSANASINVTSVNADTASKLSTARKINITGNASGAAAFDGSGDININTTVNESKHAVNADVAKTLETTEANGVKSNGQFYWIGKDGQPMWLWGSNTKPSETYVYNPSNFHVAYADNAATATTATTANSLNEALDRPASANVAYNDGKIRYFLATGNMSEGKPSGGDGPVIHLSWDRPLWESQITINSPSGHIQTRTQDTGTWGSWKTVLDSDNFNNYAPTKTGGGASGTWGISISGNADSATNADKVDGYHASDLLRILGGNRTPVITDIFDRAGTIDMSTMSTADKATHKANINKAPNMTQNAWNNSTGIHAYSGDADMSGYPRGTLKLTQSYKNFDKIMVIGTEDKANFTYYKLWDVWELANAFANNDCFMLITSTGNYWMLVGTAKHGNAIRKLSTDTIWSCQQQDSGIVAIYGIKY